MVLTVSFTIILMIITLDQVLKMFLMSQTFAYISGFLYNAPVLNDGAAFSILSGEVSFFIIFTIAILCFVFYILITNKFTSSKFFKYSLAVLTGGIIGNLLDRYFLNAVRDFWYVKPFGFVCNFADIAICVGTVLLCVYIIFLHDYKDGKNKKLANKSSTNEESVKLDTDNKEKQ